MLKKVICQPWPFFRWNKKRHDLDLLKDNRSLTRYLEAIGGNQPGVDLLFEGWGIPGAEEVERLRLRTGQLAWIRETEITVRGQSVIAARSVFPADLIRGRFRQVRSMGRKSLGKILFSKKSIKRQYVWFERQRIDEREIPVRHSLFRLGNKQMLLTEFFLRQPERIFMAGETCDD